MKEICLVACAASKRVAPAAARDLYVSPLFEKSRDYAERAFDRWYILSAKHGLLRPDERTEPYDETLNRVKRDQRRQWADCVLRDLLRRTRPGDVVTILAGRKYRDDLVPRLQEHGREVRIPMEGLRIGEQLSWLNSALRQSCGSK